MNPSRIEKAIDEIYDYVENCKPAKLAPNKVTVAKDELYDLSRCPSYVCTGGNSYISEDHS